MTKQRIIESENGYAMVEGAQCVVLPVDVATQVFALLCKGTKVKYDWQTKTHTIDNEYLPTLRMFSITEYATLQLSQD